METKNEVWLLGFIPPKSSGRQTTMAANYPCLLIFTPLCNPFPLNIGGTCDVFLTNKLWHRNGMPLSRLCYWDCNSILPVDSFLPSQCACFDEASSHSGEAHVVKNSKLGTEAVFRNRTLPTMWAFRWDPALTNTLMAAHERPWCRGPSEAVPDPWHTEILKWKMCVILSH